MIQNSQDNREAPNIVQNIAYNLFRSVILYTRLILYTLYKIVKFVKWIIMLDLFTGKSPTSDLVDVWRKSGSLLKRMAQGEHA